MKHIKGAIFDLDGTLLDSMDVWERIDIDFLAKRAIPVTREYVETVTPMSFQAAAEYTISAFGLRESPEDIIAEWRAMAADAYAHRVGLKPGARDYLAHLRSQGVRLAVATASEEALYRPALERNGVYGLFDAFATVKEVPRGKGYPDVYLLAAARLGLPAADCAVFEDICAGIRGAKAGGFYAVGVYEPYCDYEKDEIVRTADLYIHSFHDLLPAAGIEG